MPRLLERTEIIRDWLKGKTYEELKELWNCSEAIAKQNFKRLEQMELQNDLTPALLSYERIAYQYMAPMVFEQQQLDYVQDPVDLQKFQRLGYVFRNNLLSDTEYVFERILNQGTSQGEW